MNQVKIYNGDGELKEILSPEEVKKISWSQFDDNATVGKSRRKKQNPKPKRVLLNLPDRPCDGCGTVYTPSRKNNNFCHKKCQQAKYRESRKAPEFEKLCEKCGKSYTGTQSRRWCNNPCSFYITKDGKHSWTGK